MSKKQINKKKISVKLTHGETAIVLGYDTFLHIAETYDYLASQEEKNEHRDAYYEIADSIRYQAGENYFQQSEDEEDYAW